MTPAGPDLPLLRLVLTGEAALPDGVSLPEDARLVAEFRAEMSTAQEAAFRLDTAVPPGPGPLAFAVELPPTFSLDEGPYRLRLRVQSGPVVLYATEAPVRIASDQDLTGISMRLADPDALLRAALITPGGAAHVCGGERVILAIETGAAYITYPTGESARLRKVDASGSSAEQFSNGDLLLERQHDTATGTARLAFASGGGDPQLCTLAR
ncbi:hypothetical protein [Hyphomonas sp.]|uniref:hypothetical protein n=1 Tax=Hyphomonas sp. TaxID=87 RepID=UPI003919881B